MLLVDADPDALLELAGADGPDALGQTDPEAAVFALSAGEISDVLETPKGFWIVKRIE